MIQPSIPYINLFSQWQDERTDLLPIIETVMSSGWFIGGETVERFEQKTAELAGTRFCVALNSGTDALVCGLMALGVRADDEVITPPNSFVASAASIVHLRAKPVFVDVLPDQNIDPEHIKRAITKRTRAIMPVHLTGRVAAMDEILEISNCYGIPIIEDAAQSIGSRYKGRQAGSLGNVGCFSAHPLKNLNACGDAGFLTTDDPDIDRKIRMMRNHGLINRNTVERFGHVSRMDVLQAAILEYRISRLPKVLDRRRRNADFYRRFLNQEYVFIPEEQPGEFNTYHTFVIQCDQRDELREYLRVDGVETAVHYPIPIHLQPAAAFLGHGKGSFPATERQAERILTLPVHQYLHEKAIREIAVSINQFFETHVHKG